MTIICDRCKKLKHDCIETPTATGGFYNVTEGSWAKYNRGGEWRVCDACMWADPNYIAEYGLHL
jgi:hypothetical protein